MPLASLTFTIPIQVSVQPGDVILYCPTTLTAGINTASTSDFVGFASQAYTNGQTATINVVGNTATKSGLTAGTKYYVQNDGSLGTTAGSHSAVGGIALSSTKLLIK